MPILIQVSEFNPILWIFSNEHKWVTAKIGLSRLDPDLDQNKHRINLESVRIK